MLASTSTDFSKLPGEVQDSILANLSTSDLARILVVNSTIHHIALRRLYRSLSLSAVPKRAPRSCAELPSGTPRALSLPASLKCLLAIVNSDFLALQVRSLSAEFSTYDLSLARTHLPEVDWPSDSEAVPLANIYSLLRRALLSMQNLSSLSISLSLIPFRNRRGLTLATHVEGLTRSSADGAHSSNASPYVKMLANPYSILEDAPFRLTNLETNAPFDASLSRVLSSQSSLTELTLRSVAPQDRSQNGSSRQFSLPPDALPRLQHLRAIHASPAILKELVSGRPVRSVYIPLRPLSFPRLSSSSLFDDDEGAADFPCLKVLAKSSVPITRLTVFSFDFKFLTLPSSDPSVAPKADDGPSLVEKLFTQIATVSCDLESLQVIVMMSPCRVEDLEAAAPLLAPYKNLKSITYMAQSDTLFNQTPIHATDAPKEDSAQRQRRLIKQEKRVVDAWDAYCPSLRTILLPRGQVWFKRTCSASRDIAHCCCCGRQQQPEARVAGSSDVVKVEATECVMKRKQTGGPPGSECGATMWCCEKEVALNLEQQQIKKDT